MKREARVGSRQKENEMRHGIIGPAVIAAVLALSPGSSMAAQEGGQAAPPAAAQAKPKAAKQGKQKSAPKLVDINAAGAAELKKLPGIGDAEAAKIIAGRPYHSKAELVTHDVLPRGVYEGLKARVIAIQH
jgi:DNA uptake protein ComE-like DNA-binding protein